jgi:hypothetical protein
MRLLLFFLALLSRFFLALTQAHADHVLEFLPSYYPHEIRIEAIDTGSAATRLSSNSIHAYLGGDPFTVRSAPATLSHVDSLRSYLVITFNPAFGDRNARCTAGSALLRWLSAEKGGYIFHPYPVTPYHSDYLQHLDLIESAQKRYSVHSSQSAVSLAFKVLAKGKLAQTLARPLVRGSQEDWVAMIEEIDNETLLSSYGVSNAWLGPPWLKEGWFSSYLLLSGMLHDKADRGAADAIYERLVTGSYQGEVEHLNLERRLVSTLAAGCERMVVGYTVRREYFNSSDYSEGLENIAYDSQAGLNAPIFLRTVKLKDFLWNGWLRLGVEGKMGAAWNPVGGFGDAAGRIIWAAVGDPAQVPHPYNSTWIANRVALPPVTFEALPASAIEIPATALRPEPGSGMLRPAGEGKTAKAKIHYRVLLSAFHDGTLMGVADILYAYAFAYRWGVKSSRSGADYDLFVDTSTALLREWLAGIQPLQTEQEIKVSGETKYVFQVQPIDVYLERRLNDSTQMAAIAPPWSTLPWHVVVLMEEAIKRHLATFSQGETKHRRPPWLDLVRNERLKTRLASLVEQFRREGYVPPALQNLVTSAEARMRWTALREFYKAHHHFLVTNGPYRLHKWSANSVTLQAFRDVTYPLGLGLFDHYPIPRRAYISGLKLHENRLEVRADVEKIQRFQRTYTVVREPLTGSASEIDHEDLPECRYVVVNHEGVIADLGNAPYADAAGTFTIELNRSLKPGFYNIITGLFVGGNQINPDLKSIRYRVEGQP